eukprot:12408114-Karenia_brevis.AAC.1
MHVPEGLMFFLKELDALTDLVDDNSGSGHLCIVDKEAAPSLVWGNKDLGEAFLAALLVMFLNYHMSVVEEAMVRSNADLGAQDGQWRNEVRGAAN